MDEKHGEEVDLLALFGDHYMKGPDVVVTKHSLEIRCCTCSDRQGHLTCTGCFAVRYCSEQCRRVQWDKHKNVCKEIRRSRKMLLATQASENFEAETVAREKLQTAFVNCGEANGSPLAFRLAAENIDGFDKPRQNYKHMGWMLAAGGMDQEVLNYYRRFTGEKVPRDPWEYFLDKDLDIEEDFYLDKIKLHHDDDAWYIDFMAIALIKYNRLKTLIVNRQRNDVKWRTFMMGTHPRVGQNSSILGIRGIACIVEKLGLFVTGKPDHVNKRISKLSAQIEKILSAVHKKNNLIIPCIMDKSLISATKAGAIGYGYNSPQTYAYWTNVYFGLAWNMGAASISYLAKFVQTGEVFNSGQEKYPVDRLVADAKDVDPRHQSGSRDQLFLFF